jgi:hypothetical protein
MARRPDSATPSTRHPSQLLALAIGAVYTLLSVLRFWSARARSRASPSMSGHALSTGTVTVVPTDCRHLVAFG